MTDTTRQINDLLDFLDSAEDQTPCFDYKYENEEENEEESLNEIDKESQEFKDYSRCFCGDETLTEYWLRRKKET